MSKNKGYHGEKPENYFRQNQPTTPPGQPNRNGTVIQEDSVLKLQKFNELIGGIALALDSSHKSGPTMQSADNKTSAPEPSENKEQFMAPVMRGYLYQIKYAVCQKGKSAIYVLIDPDTKEIRFAARSETPAGSYALHIASSRSYQPPQNSETRKNSLQAWIQALETHGKFPEIYVIEESNVTTIIQRERAIISQLKKHGAKLLTDMEKKPSGLYSMGEIQYIAKIYGGACLSAEHIFSTETLEWTCTQGHQWSQTLADVLAGNWCPQCDQILEKEKGTQAFQELCTRRSIMALDVVGYPLQEISRQKKLDLQMVEEIIDSANF
ncbi:MAG: hypothetical protein HQM14_04465 [SAR324 cluster bacterium]|nr:hypothetical protein [SAR324 cluster bacterium]